MNQKIIKLNDKLKYIVPYLVLCTLVFLLYGQCLNFEYVWDDNYIFVNRTLLREKNITWAAVSNPIIYGSSYFRPVVMFSWFLEMQVFRLEPGISHAINVIIFYFNLSLIYFLACKIFEKYVGKEEVNKPALCATVLYAVNPCLVESVAWVSGRFDLLCTTFILVGCIVTNYQLNFKKGFIFFLSSLFAMGSKELGVLLPVFAALFLYARYPENSFNYFYQQLKGYFLIFFISMIIYFIARKISIESATYANINMVDIINSLKSLVWIRVMSFYIFTLLFPFFQITPQHEWVKELDRFHQFLPILVLVFILFISSIFFTIKRHVWAILLLGFFVGISLVLRIIYIPLGDTIGAERFLCFPAVFFSFFVIRIFLNFFEKIKKFQRLKIFIKKACFLFWLSMSFFVSHTYAATWQDSLHLWGWLYYKDKNQENQMVFISYMHELANSKNQNLEREFENIIRDVMDKHEGSLPVTLQYMYANYLFNKGDSEAMNYYRGIVYHQFIPKPKAGLNDIDMNLLLGLMEQLRYWVYLNYSNGLLVYEGELDESKKYLELARPLILPGVEYSFLTQEIIVKSLSGEVDVARELYKKIESKLHDKDLNKGKNRIGSGIYAYCMLRNNNDIDYCFNYMENLLRSIIEGIPLSGPSPLVVGQSA